MESPPVKSTKMATKPKPLSRLKEERGKDPCYLSQYYFEHKDNFGIFFMILLEGSTVTKLISNAKDIALRFVRQLHLAPDDYTDDVISKAYDTLKEAFLAKGEPIKTLMLNGMTSYFEVIKEINKESGTLEEARSFFSDSSAQSKLHLFADELLGKKHDANKAAKFFYPQLCLFFERFFEIYDSAIKGAPAMEVIKQIEKQQQQEKLNQIKNDPNTLKNVWKETSQKNTPMGPTEPFKYDRNADLEPSNPQIEEELDALAEHYTNGRLDFQALWNYRGDDFEEKWKNLEDDKRKEYINISRSYVAGRAEMGIAFCPELNDELAAGELLLKFMKDCAKFNEDISQLDSFTSKLHLQMKSKGMESKKSLVTIIYSRRWTLCAFAVNLMFEVLELGKENPQANETRVEEIKEEEPEKIPTIQNLANEAMTKSVAKDKPLPEVVEKANPLEKPLTRKCSASGCLNREVEGAKFNVCGSCKKVGIIVPYCSKDCQLKDWKEGHKAKCGSK